MLLFGPDFSGRINEVAVRRGSNAATMYINAFVTLFRVNRAKAIVTHLVHQTVEKDLGTTPVDTELSSGGVVIMLLNVLALFCTPSNTNHPQELVDI